MPKVDSQPQHLRPYLFHGVVFGKQSGKEHQGNCVFCGGEKFFLNEESGQWKCFNCSAGSPKGGGNLDWFLVALHAESDKLTNDYEELAANRKLLCVDTLMHWQVSRSIATGDWLVPGYRTDNRRLSQLYRYVKDAAGKRRLLPTPTLGHGLHGVNLYDPSRPVVYICEGPWDAIALWETLRSAKEDGEGGLAFTASEHSSLLAKASVLAVPGCSTFDASWLRLLEGKDVVMLYDSDHPKVHPKTGQPIQPAGHAGLKRAVGIMATAETPPRGVSYLHWGDEGYDPDLPSGHDVRDALTRGATPPERVRLLADLLRRVRPVPAQWAGGTRKGAARGRVELEPLRCESIKVLRAAWRRAMEWTPGLDRALLCMLATAAAVKSPGDQLWMKVVSPPSGGKTSLCEALAVARQYVKSLSVIRGFHSGFQTDRNGSEDCSLLNQLRDKCLVTKDGDTLLQSPNLPQILAEARDIYDRNSRTHYRNKMSREYDNVNMSWLLCGTGSLRALDSSELGERFLDCVIMERIDTELETRINQRKIRQLKQLFASEPSVNDHGADSPEMVKAKRLTGGYIIHLRDNMRELLGRVRMPDEFDSHIEGLGQFVSYIRARPSLKQTEDVSRELSARLVGQFVKLAFCLAVVMDRETVDEDVYEHCRKVAVDTARGHTLEVVRFLYRERGKGGMAMHNLVTGPLEPLGEAAATRYVKFLRKLEVLSRRTDPTDRYSKRYVLSSEVNRLYEEIIVKHDQQARATV